MESCLERPFDTKVRRTSSTPSFPPPVALFSPTSSTLSLPVYTYEKALPDFPLRSTSQSEQPPPFSAYHPRSHVSASQHGKIITYDQHLNSDVEALYQWLHTSSASPPRPHMRLLGTHHDSNNKTAVDFSLRFDLPAFLLPIHTLATASRCRQGTRSSHPVAEDGMNIRDWCAEYIAAADPWKEFKLRKKVVGLDKTFLRRKVAAAVKDTGYAGTVTITFPVEERTVVVAPDTWVSRARYGPCRWVFYVSLLWVILWPLLWVVTRKWDVVEVHWETASAEKDWAERWRWVISRMVQKREQSACAFTEMHLRRIEMEEILLWQMEQHRRKASLTPPQGKLGKFLWNLGSPRKGSSCSSSGGKETSVTVTEIEVP